MLESLSLLTIDKVQTASRGQSLDFQFTNDGARKDPIDWHIRIELNMQYNTLITIFVNLRLSLVSNLICGPQQHGLMFASSYLNHLDMSS